MMHRAYGTSGGFGQVSRRAFVSLLAALPLVTLSACASSGGETESMKKSNGDAGSTPPAASAGTSVSIIDVGKGDCVLVENSGHAMLVDAGYEQTADDVLAFLDNRGITGLDTLIISHYDKDHYGGAPAILDALHVGQLLLPSYEGVGKRYSSFMQYLASESIPYERVVKDGTFTLGNASCKIYVPSVEYAPGASDEEGNDNDMSLVVSVTCGADSFLFAGDMEKDGLKGYLSAHGAERYGVVKMPHHGQWTSKLKDFVTSTAPQIAVITDSTDDPANKKVLNLLGDQDIDVYRSSLDGTVMISGTGAGAYDVWTSR